MRATPRQQAYPYPAPYTPSGSNYAAQALIQWLDRVGHAEFCNIVQNDTYATKEEAIKAREIGLTVLHQEIQWEKDYQGMCRQRRRGARRKPKAKGGTFPRSQAGAVYSHESHMFVVVHTDQNLTHLPADFVDFSVVKGTA